MITRQAKIEDIYGSLVKDFKYLITLVEDSIFILDLNDIEIKYNKPFQFPIFTGSHPEMEAKRLKLAEESNKTRKIEKLKVKVLFSNNPKLYAISNQYNVSKHTMCYDFGQLEKIIKDNFISSKYGIINATGLSKEEILEKSGLCKMELCYSNYDSLTFKFKANPINLNEISGKEIFGICFEDKHCKIIEDSEYIKQILEILIFLD